MIYLKDAHKQFKVVFFINNKGRVSESFISDSDKKIEKWMEEHSKITGLFAIHLVGSLVELIPSDSKKA
jgi:hypothetical protein